MASRNFIQPGQNALGVPPSPIPQTPAKQSYYSNEYGQGDFTGRRARYNDFSTEIDKTPYQYSVRDDSLPPVEDNKKFLESLIEGDYSELLASIRSKEVGFRIQQKQEPQLPPEIQREMDAYASKSYKNKGEGKNETRQDSTRLKQEEAMEETKGEEEKENENEAQHLKKKPFRFFHPSRLNLVFRLKFAHQPNIWSFQKVVHVKGCNKDGPTRLRPLGPLAQPMHLALQHP